MFQWLARFFRRSQRPLAQDDSFSHLSWLEPDQNPFGLRVLDCRPFTTTVLSVTQDPAIASHFGQLRGSTGEEHRGRQPADPLVASCRLSYPFNGQSRDGPLFVARQMEDKWDIYLYDGCLYFARSWTGDLAFRAAIAFGEREAVLTTIEANRAKVMDDPVLPVRMVDFLVKSHLHRQETPHPLPPGFPDDKKAIALYSVSEYGRWAHYASFADTTQFRIGGGP